MHILEEAIIYKNELIISIHQLMMVVIILIKTTLIFQLFHIYMAPHYTIMHFSSIFQGVKDENNFDFFWWQQINASHALTQYFIIVTHFATYVRSTQHSSTAELVCWCLYRAGGRGRSYSGRNGTYIGVITHYNETPDKLTSP